MKKQDNKYTILIFYPDGRLQKVTGFSKKIIDYFLRLYFFAKP
jgi:hypothetical protein